MKFDLEKYGELKVESDPTDDSFLPKKMIHFLCPSCKKRICSPSGDGGVVSDCYYCGCKLLLPTSDDVNQQKKRIRDQAVSRKEQERQHKEERRKEQLEREQALKERQRLFTHNQKMAKQRKADVRFSPRNVVN